MYFFINKGLEILLQTYFNSLHVQRKKAFSRLVDTKLINMPLFICIFVVPECFAKKYPFVGSF